MFQLFLIKFFNVSQAFIDLQAHVFLISQKLSDPRGQQLNIHSLDAFKQLIKATLRVFYPIMCLQKL